MNYPTYFESKKTINLYGLFPDFNFLKELYTSDKLPHVLMLSGNKGSGKATLVNHLMHFIFDQNNYDVTNYKIIAESNFNKLFKNNIFSNIIYLSGSNLKNIKIDDIRNLKGVISQTSISNKKRFIILDDIELFNKNSLNALLKVIEEPRTNNYFILINNKSKPLIETIKSRCLEIKIILSNNIRLEIINSLTSYYKLNPTINVGLTSISPGSFLKYNYICESNKIDLNNSFLINLKIIMNLYKKEKDIIYIDLMLFFTHHYFNNLRFNKKLNNKKIIENKLFVLRNINSFFLYNLNQTALLNTINNKITDE